MYVHFLWCCSVIVILEKQQNITWGLLCMRVDVLPGHVWIEIDQPQLGGQPPILRIPVRAGHNFTDRRSELRLNLQVMAWNSTLGVARVDLFIPQGSAHRVQQEAIIVLSSDTIHTIETARQKNRSDDVVLNIKVTGLYASWPTSPHQTAPLDMRTISTSGTFRISLGEWKNVLGLTEHRLVLLDASAIDKLEELRRKWGLWRVEDVIYKLIEAYEGVGVGITHQFLVTLIESKTIRDKIDELSKSPRWREVRVVSLYLDNTGAEYLIRMIKNGAKVRIITRKSDSKAHRDALEALKQLGAEIRIHKMAHARMIVFDDLAAIISSADLDSEGLNNQRQASIYTTDKTVVRDAIVFFDKLWEEAAPY